MPHPPLAPDQAFRRAVARLRLDERRRTFPLTVHVGAPEGETRQVSVPWPAPTDYDPGLRFDVLDGLVETLLDSWEDEDPVWVWVTRPGVPETHDDDLAWFAVANRVLAAHDVTWAGFRAVTRTGWLDVATGESRTWTRLRL